MENDEGLDKCREFPGRVTYFSVKGKKQGKELQSFITSDSASHDLFIYIL